MFVCVCERRVCVCVGEKTIHFVFKALMSFIVCALTVHSVFEEQVKAQFLSTFIIIFQVNEE